MNVSFSELARLSSAHAARALRDCLDEISKHFHTRNETAGGTLYPLVLAALTLVARQRYSDMAVRALMRSIRIEAVGGFVFQVFLSPVTELEKTFLAGDSEHGGLKLMARTAETDRLVLSRIESASAPIQNNLERLIRAVFGHYMALTPEERAAERAAVADEVGTLLSQCLRREAAALKLFFAGHVVPHLVDRTPSTDEPLPIAAPLRIACALPDYPVAESLASAYRVHYEVEEDSVVTSRTLDAGAEVHAAPEGASQAIERVYTHLRHRWYPVATAVTVNRIDVLPPSAFPRLSRHFSVLVEGAHENLSSLAIGRTIDEARANLESCQPYPNATLRERPLYISGRKARPPLRLDRFLKAVEADGRSSP